MCARRPGADDRRRFYGTPAAGARRGCVSAEALSVRARFLSCGRARMSWDRRRSCASVCVCACERVVARACACVGKTWPVEGGIASPGLVAVSYFGDGSLRDMLSSSSRVRAAVPLPMGRRGRAPPPVHVRGAKTPPRLARAGVVVVHAGRTWPVEIRRPDAVGLGRRRRLSAPGGRGRYRTALPHLISSRLRASRGIESRSLSDVRFV